MYKENDFSKIKFNNLVKNPTKHRFKIKTENRSLGFFKTLLFLLLIAFQLATLILLNLYVVFLYSWLIIVTLSLSVCTCIYILSSSRNPHSKAIWILFVLTCFVFGYLVYFVSDEKVFFRNSRRRYKKIYCKSFKQISDQGKKELINSNSLSKYLYESAKFLPFSNYEYTYHSSGAKFFQNVLKELKKAEKFIFLEFYIISEGALLSEILEVLKAKAKAGVQVKIIYDGFGSHGSFSHKTKKQIRKSGIELFSFNKFTPKISIALNFRDHRKIIVIDGKTAFTGGANIGDEYTNRKKQFGYWKDAGIELHGECVSSFTNIFLRQWEFVSKKQIDYSKYLSETFEQKGKNSTKLKSTNSYENQKIIIPYADGLDIKNNISKDLFSNIIGEAKEKIYISTPYFIPDSTLLDLLKLKALSGVDVRILLPNIPDKKIVFMLTSNHAEKLLDYGVKIYSLKNSFVHSKLVLSEKDIVLGTSNFDLRSLYQQFECGIYSNDTSLIKEVSADFNACFKESIVKNKQNLRRNKLWFRFVAGIFQIISPFM